MKSLTRGGSVEARTLIERQIRRWNRIDAVLKKASPEKPLAEVSRRPVLTVSGSAGSGRERLAVALCKELDYELYGRELLDAVASDLHCQRMLLEGLDEKVQSNIRLIFESWLRGREIDHREYISALFRVMGSLAERGGAVILGRGGAFILGAKAALRVRLEAPLPLRVRRTMESRKVSEDEARHFVQTKDREQEEFLRRYFHSEASDPLAFDLAINTERIEPEKAVGIVLSALAQRGIEIRKPAI